MKTRRLDANYDVSFGHGFSDFATGSEAVEIEVETRLNQFQGEWFLDDDAGTPYFQSIVGKPININDAATIIKQRILDTNGVDSMLDFSMDFNRDTRKMKIACTVVDIYGNVLPIEV